MGSRENLYGVLFRPDRCPLQILNIAHADGTQAPRQAEKLERFTREPRPDDAFSEHLPTSPTRLFFISGSDQFPLSG